MQQEVSYQKSDFDLIPVETRFGALAHPQARRILAYTSAEIPVEDRRERARGKFGTKKLQWNRKFGRKLRRRSIFEFNHDDENLFTKSIKFKEMFFKTTKSILQFKCISL